MEFNMLKILLCHREHIATIGQKNVTPFSVFSHILIFAFFETFQFSKLYADARVPNGIWHYTRAPNDIG